MTFEFKIDVKIQENLEVHFRRKSQTHPPLNLTHFRAFCLQHLYLLMSITFASNRSALDCFYVLVCLNDIFFWDLNPFFPVHLVTNFRLNYWGYPRISSTNNTCTILKNKKGEFCMLFGYNKKTSPKQS